MAPRATRWLHIAGQVGIKPDGTLAQGFAAQTERCWANLFAVLAGAGMTKRDLVKITVFVTAPDRVALYREIRDRVLEGHAPAATYLVVAGLAHPDYLVEIEGVAAA
jgi:2-iminobutanoate/2-iminopropanoate deaminase